MVPLAWCRLKISGRAPGPSSLYGLTAPNGPPSLGGGGGGVGGGGLSPPPSPPQPPHSRVHGYNTYCIV